MNVIEVNALTKKFGREPVLKGIDLAVQKGEVFGFLGPNGAGKTTTMRLILGLLAPTSGQALVLGQDLGEDNELRKRVGVLLEDDGLYPNLSARDNLAYFARLYEVEAAEERITEVLDIVGLKGRESDKLGYYSKGMKRRLGLARAIIHKPEILLMDEPSSGLDPEAQKLVRDLIIDQSRQEGVTIFLNSHDLDEVQRICSHVAILQRGRIKALDTVANLTSVKKPGLSIIFPDVDEAKRGETLITTLDNVARVNRKGNFLQIDLNSPDTSGLLKELMKQDIKVDEVRKMKRSLEDIYLEAVHQEEEQ
jgi:ABC-2 type transport system ATP-binding protein